MSFLRLDIEVNAANLPEHQVELWFAKIESHVSARLTSVGQFEAQIMRSMRQSQRAQTRKMDLARSPRTEE